MGRFYIFEGRVLQAEGTARAKAGGGLAEEGRREVTEPSEVREVAGATVNK